MASSNKKPQQQTPQSPLSSFVYKATFVCLLIALLPIFPSQSPDSPSNNNTILTRTLELLRLLFVGIVVSYGLFSRRNPEPEADGEAPQPQSYVSKLLHVPSVFDEDDEPVESPRANATTQTWSYSQYNPEAAVVMSKKPLSLPVRSLKPTDEGDVVLPSPIPWRSRSGRMEVNTETAPSKVPSSHSPSPPRSISPPVRKKSFHKPPPPPPPPPPPLFSSHRQYFGAQNKHEIRVNEAGLRRKRKEKKKKKNVFREKMIIESDSSNSDRSDVDELVPSSAPADEGDANEVDKKADEFIAKFREQIRLQRIASIKRSTAQRNSRSQSGS